MRPETSRAPEPRGRTGPGATPGASPRRSPAQPRLSCTAMWALGPLVPIAALAAAASSTPASAQSRARGNPDAVVAGSMTEIEIVASGGAPR